MSSNTIVHVQTWKVAELLEEYADAIGKPISQAGTQLLEEGLDTWERTKRRQEHEYEIKKSEDEIADLKSRRFVPPDNPEGDELDADLAELIRRAGIDNVYHGVARRLIEEITKTDVEVLRRYALSFVQANQRNGPLLDRIARALEQISREVSRHDR